MPVATPTPSTVASQRRTGARELTLNDRCDRCGAQAWVRATLASTAGTLFFCAHHAGEIRDDLLPQCSHWLDESRFLNEKPSVSASG